MSTGQAKVRDNMVAEALMRHVERLQSTGYTQIADIVYDLNETIHRFEALNPELKRNGFLLIDRMKTLLGRLS